jgi:hypothetical protein
MAFMLSTTLAAAGLGGCDPSSDLTTPTPDFAITAPVIPTPTQAGEPELAVLVQRVSTLKAGVEAAGRVTPALATERDRLVTDIGSWRSWTGRADIRAERVALQQDDEGPCPIACDLFKVIPTEEGLRICILVSDAETCSGIIGNVCVYACIVLTPTTKQYLT